jgi:hypothetical protein
MAYFKALVRNLPGGIEIIHEKHVRVAVLTPRFEQGISGMCIRNVKHLIAAFRCGTASVVLVVKVSGDRYRGPGSIPGATRFFLRSSGSGTGSTQPRDDN